MAMIKKQLILEGLCCENCAAKIQNDICRLDGIKSAEINADTRLLSVEFDANMKTLILVQEITRIAVSHDEDIVVKEV